MQVRAWLPNELIEPMYEKIWDEGLIGCPMDKQVVSFPAVLSGWSKSVLHYLKENPPKKS